MNNLIEKINKKKNCNGDNPGITIAFLGDSITQGCFEFYFKNDGTVETVFDQEHAYCQYLKKILSRLYPNVPFSVINAGVSGGTAVHGLERLERDVLRHEPDLVVVCFGLNDAVAGEKGITEYVNALRNIFSYLAAAGIDVIFMTPNMAPTTVNPRIKPEFKEITRGNAERQNSGITTRYIDAAKNCALQMKVPVCDCYSIWQRLEQCGVDTSELQADYMIHPARDTNWIFALSLAKTIFEI